MTHSTKFSIEQREELIQRWKESGKGKKEFADEHGIKYMTFISWVRQRQTKKSIEAPVHQFVPLEFTTTNIFAEIILGKNKITLHQPVSAEFLKLLFR